MLTDLIKSINLTRHITYSAVQIAHINLGIDLQNLSHTINDKINHIKAQIEIYRTLNIKKHVIPNLKRIIRRCNAKLHKIRTNPFYKFLCKMLKELQSYYGNYDYTIEQHIKFLDAVKEFNEKHAVQRDHLKAVEYWENSIKLLDRSDQDDQIDLKTAIKEFAKSRVMFHMMKLKTDHLLNYIQEIAPIPPTDKEIAERLIEPIDY